MARSTEEIKSTMTDAFLNDKTLREAYGIEEGTPWSKAFSSVTLENILIFIVAACTRTLEVIFDQYEEDVEEKISKAIVASVPWYYKLAKAYQHGDELVINADTYSFGYENVDETKQVIKYCAVRDQGNIVYILVNGETNGVPSLLSNDVLTPFKAYMNKVKVAGVVLTIKSYASDHVKIEMSVKVDRTLIDTDGKYISDGSKPVVDAIEAYLKNIDYGGTFNKTKLVDAVQAVKGVLDVELGVVKYRADADSSFSTLSGNNYDGVSGSYIADDLNNTIEYVV